MVLLAGAALLGETVVRLTAQPLGFESKGLVMLRPSLLVSLPPEIRTNRRRTLIEHLRNTRGVEAVAAVPQRRSAATTAAKRSKSTNSPGQFVPARRYIVGTDYFRTMGMSLARGRDFGPADAGGPPMMIVSQDFERRYLTGAGWAPSAHQQRVDDGRRRRGPDTKLRRLAENDEPAFYLSLEQMPRLSATEIVIRTKDEAVRRCLQFGRQCVTLVPAWPSLRWRRWTR